MHQFLTNFPPKKNPNKLHGYIQFCGFFVLLLDFISYVFYLYRDHCVNTEILMNMSFLAVIGLTVCLALITLRN
jgi:hypothetical protein